MTTVSCAVEGALDEVIARRLLAHVGLVCGPIYAGEGKQRLRRRIRGYAHGARRDPWFVLVDLDHEHACAAALVDEWLPQVPALMRLRIAVREVEAWLLADRAGIATFLSISRDRIPRKVDELDDPKSLMISVASRSRRRAIREGVPPRAASGRSIGPLYVSELSRLVWSIGTWTKRRSAVPACAGVSGRFARSDEACARCW